MPETPAAEPEGGARCPLCQGRKRFERLYPRVFDEHYGTRIAAFLQEHFREADVPHELLIDSEEDRTALLAAAEQFGALGPGVEGRPTPAGREAGEGEPILRHPRELLTHIERIVVQACTSCRGVGACWICKGEGRLRAGGLRKRACWACAGNGLCRMCLGSKRELRLEVRCERCEGRGTIPPP